MRGNQKNKDYVVRWTAEFAYAIGLITTDGCLSPDGRHFDFTSKDIQLIKTFKKCLGLKVKIGTKNSGYSKKKYYHVQFGNVVLYKWLLNIGLMPNKSKIIGVLKIPDKYFFDFLRGHLDGDGYVRKFQDQVYPNSQRVYTNFHSASLKHLQWLQERTKKLLSINGFIMHKIREFSLTYAKKESLKLLSHLYYDSNVPCLRRKYKIVESLL
ncbi:hypothetical protein KKG58_01710 [Patescibacteria group bacterium]|nr:hypothetical protein [Patescibacteria group bacterium]